MDLKALITVMVVKQGETKTRLNKQIKRQSNNNNNDDN